MGFHTYCPRNTFVVSNCLAYRSQRELQVAQASLDAKLFQNPRLGELLDSKSDFGGSNASPKIFIPSQYFCGFPVPKDSGQIGNKSGLLGAIVLLKGGLSPIIGNRDHSSSSRKNSSISPLEFNTYASVYCAKKLISRLPNPAISRYVTFLEHVVMVPLSLSEKSSLEAPNFCADKTDGSDPTGHVLVRAFAVANQVASSYPPPTTVAALGSEELRLFAATTTAQSRLESIALLTALLTTWSGDNEAKFQAYLNAFKLPSAIPSQSGISAKRYRWLEEIEHPRFCVPTDTFSCTCPRQLLVYSMAQRYRRRLMASLRREATSVHTALPSSIRTLASASGGDDPTDSDWPHRVLALLSPALCNQAVPLTPNNQAADAETVRTVKICDLKGDKEGQFEDCVSEGLVQKLWEITSYTERKLALSSAHREFAKLSTYPFLRIVGQEITKLSAQGNEYSTPWLQVYAGQPDSIYQLLIALNISVGSLDHRRTAGRLVVEVFRSPPGSSSPTHLRFLLDGVNIGESLKALGLCESNPPFCPTERFLAFIKGPEFWGPLLGAHSMDSSEDAFNFFCNSADFRTLN
ncbi:hypothetical protein Aperf_G00000031676 [Anoplocephala perfoliata]